MAKTFVDTFTEQVKSTVERYQMLPPGSVIIAGFSGGADSMALVSVLNEINLRGNMGWRVVGAHVHHGLRGAEADRDASHCAHVCESMGLDFESLHADVPAMAEESGESFEACGRRVRYAFFAELAEKYGHLCAGSHVAIATAHNANDSAETILFRLARGTGLHGLTGIPPVRDNIVRPLIDTTRKDIEHYCSDMGLEYVTDSTNADTEYARNKIRLEIIPKLEEINGGALENIARCISLLRDEDEALEHMAGELISEARLAEGRYSCAVLSSAEPALRDRALARILAACSGKAAETIHIKAVAELLCQNGQGGQLQIPSGTYVRVRDGLLTFPEVSDASAESFSVTAERPEESCTVEFSGRTVTLRCIQNDRLIDRAVLENCVDYDKINITFVLRNRNAGDRYSPRYRNVTKSLKNLFNEAKIPPEERSSLVILDNGGEIAFIEGFGSSDEYKVTKDTKRLLYIDIK